MEDHIVFKSFLDSLCAKMDVTSWTVYENQRGTVCTIRFSDMSAIFNSSIRDSIKQKKHCFLQKKFKLSSQPG